LALVSLEEHQGRHDAYASDQPVGDVSNPNFGSIISTVNTPTSILGSFLEGDASPRLIQLKGTLTS
jgi:hypothetical protein